ncbi:MAG: Ldh family oxidoreductase [Atribacterota bacterium]|nr:Ldh family oxidoreductase [Atribacterota bacterium]
MGIIIKHDNLLKFCSDVLEKAGLSKQDAFTVANSLVFANLRGIDSHGIMRFPFYLKRLEIGGTNSTPLIEIIKESTSSVLINGDNGMGQVIGVYASKIAQKKAESNGISVSAVRNSSHFGAASYYSTLIAEGKMIGVSMTGVSQNMAAWGSSKSVIGNNPISIAVPYQNNLPIVLDISMSTVAGGKVRLAAKNKEKIPKNWVVDKDGKFTDDPDALADGGALLPFGEHKGYGLAVMIEILASVLTGGGLLGEIPVWIKEFDKPLNIGHLFIAINIENFIEYDLFQKRLNHMVHILKEAPLAANFSKIYIPGELEHEKEEIRKEKGITISEEIFSDLEKISEKYKIPLKTKKYK